MKKITLLPCLFAATIAQAQTKEETIQWIHEYGSKIMLNPCLKGREDYMIGYQLTDNTLSFTFHEFGKKHRTLTVPLSDVYINQVDSLWVIKYDTDYYCQIDTKQNAARAHYYNGSADTEHKSIWFYACSEKEVKQLAKAIMHLAKFYGASPKPQVNKDTF